MAQSLAVYASHRRLLGGTQHSLPARWALPGRTGFSPVGHQLLVSRIHHSSFPPRPGLAWRTPVEDLDLVALAIAEREELWREGIEPQCLLNQN